MSSNRDQLERIAEALERIAEAMERDRQPRLVILPAGSSVADMVKLPSERGAPITQADLDAIMAQVAELRAEQDAKLEAAERRQHLAEIEASGCPCKCVWCG